MNWLLGLTTGIVFGAVLALGGLTNPRLILGMLRLKDLQLLKLLVTALVTGILGIAVLVQLGAAHMDIKTLHLLAVAIGGVVFGVGFATTGYCPGTALAGAAQGRADALFVVAGGLAGTAVFTALYATLEPVVVRPLTFGKPTVNSWLGLPVWAVAVPLALLGTLVIARWLASERRTSSDPHDKVVMAVDPDPKSA